MGNITILPEKIVGKIAAGEVVERPASVVKELLENSIDARASSVSVFIKEYGISEIKVIDDGEGIYREDVPIAFQRHATSKIKNEKDLFSIQTLGFRGEALYSIAQVSKLRIVTQHKDEDTGIELYIIGGKIFENRPAFTKGTTVEVRDLFFNTPVRRSFLKSSFTERAHIIETVQKYCLAYPEISFLLIIDGQEILNAPQVKSLHERIIQIFGAEFMERLKFRKISKDGYKIEIFLGYEEMLRRQKTNQLIFVNRRPVRDPFIVSTIYKALQIKENHPQFLIFITASSEYIDFNIHPAKKEVRFREQQKIHQLIFKMLQADFIQSNVSEKITEWKSEREMETIFNNQEIFQSFILGDSIVVILQSNGLLFVDYHAAHERVNFEKILNKIKLQTVKLVFPQIINLNTNEYFLIKENLHILNELGIEAEDFGKNSIIVRAIPDVLQNSDIAGIIESIANTIKEDTIKPDFIDLKKKIAATVACHSSLRSDNKVTPGELKILLKELEKTSDPEHCPHGRPLKRFISMNEIKKWFSR
uniref:DNA mismatch repair protein MutL n=1 Tax=Thermodesulfovibrio aggregans TaxID=86166 RepID=A0A7C4AIF6_9BACT